ncbi:MAG: hypothetical protein ACUVT7_00370 [Thermoplasmata archaeon]
MASEAKRLFGCPFCGFRISTADSACPRCGNKYTEATRFECPFCGEMVLGTAESCPACHVDYREFRAKTEKKGTDASIDSLLTEIIRLEASQVRKEEKRYSCPSCSWMLDGTEQTCPKCGVTFSNEVSFQCPICAALVDPNATRCPECGSAFVEEEAVPQKAEEQKPSTEIEGASTALTDILSTIDKAEQEPLPQEEGPKEAEAVKEPATSKGPELEAAEEPARAEAPAPAKKPRQRKLKTKTGKNR